jgi:hypothetical protein
MLKFIYNKNSNLDVGTIFEWSRVRLTLGAYRRTHSSVVERSIADLLAF